MPVRPSPVFVAVAELASTPVNVGDSWTRLYVEVSQMDAAFSDPLKQRNCRSSKCDFRNHLTAFAIVFQA